MRDKILVADDMEINREILYGIFENDYEVLLAADGRQAMEQIRHAGTELSLILLDIVMPEADGFEVMEFLKEEGLLPHIPVVMVTSDTSYESKRRGYAMGVSDFVSKPFEPEIVRKRAGNLVELYHQKNHLESIVEEQTREIRRKNEELEATNAHIIDMLGTIVEFRNVESGNHIYRVREFTKILLKHLMEDYPEYGITPKQAENIVFASVMHDVGKITIPDSILLKPGKLTEDEFELMKLHTRRGAEIVSKLFDSEDEMLRSYSYSIALYHHEKNDGRGYPFHLKGNEIPISAQVVSLADVYDALTSERVYKDAYSCEEAYNMILNGECGEFTPHMIACFKKSREEMEQTAKSL